MATQIDLVKQLATDSRNWHVQYPWFSLGQLVNLSNKKEGRGNEAATQATAMFFNDVHRLHWLLNEQDFNKNKILSELNVPISTEGMQSTPQPFPKREHFKTATTSDQLIAVAAVEEKDAMAVPQIVRNEIEEINTKIEDGDTTENKAIETDDVATAIQAQENIRALLDSKDKLEITFEPYHTIDYFASQGIKVDSKADDRLGKQLKSFTSWLKTMKRLPVTAEGTPDTTIQPIYDKSLENTNIITEAMAAVLLKQGKKEQAIETLKQLILLHPEKSPYFAAQIEQIKN